MVSTAPTFPGDDASGVQLKHSEARSALGPDDGCPSREVHPVRDGVRAMDEPRIKVMAAGAEVTITGNATGLRLIVERLEGLADPERADGCHLHLDEGIDLEDGSGSLILQRDESI